MYHFCQNSQLQTFSCPSGQAFNYATSHCEDALTVNCVETVEDHSHHQHHHHHKRSAEKLKQHKSALEKMYQEWYANIRNVTASNYLIHSFWRRLYTYNDLADFDDLITKYSKQYESWNSGSNASVSSTYFLKPDMNVFQRVPSVTELSIFQLKEILDAIKGIKNFILGLFYMNIDIRQDAFLSFIFDDTPIIKEKSPLYS